MSARSFKLVPGSCQVSGGLASSCRDSRDAAFAAAWMPARNPVERRSPVIEQDGRSALDWRSGEAQSCPQNLSHLTMLAFSNAHEGEQINTRDELYSLIIRILGGQILIGIFKKSTGKNPRDVERRAKQEERRQKAQARGQSAVK